MRGDGVGGVCLKSSPFMWLVSDGLQSHRQPRVSILRQPNMHTAASTYVQQLSFNEKTYIAGAHSVSNFFLEVDNRSLPNFNHMQMMILAAPRY